MQLVVDPHTQQVLGIESEKGEPLGAATPLDLLANARRKRRSAADGDIVVRDRTGANLVEMALERQIQLLSGVTALTKEGV